MIVGSLPCWLVPSCIIYFLVLFFWSIIYYFIFYVVFRFWHTYYFPILLHLYINLPYNSFVLLYLWPYLITLFCQIVFLEFIFCFFYWICIFSCILSCFTIYMSSLHHAVSWFFLFLFPWILFYYFIFWHYLSVLQLLFSLFIILFFCLTIRCFVLQNYFPHTSFRIFLLWYVFSILSMFPTIYFFAYHIAFTFCCMFSCFSWIFLFFYNILPFYEKISKQ